MKKLRHIPIKLKLRSYLTFSHLVTFSIALIFAFLISRVWETWTAYLALKGEVKIADGDITGFEEIDEDIFKYEYIFYNNEIGQLRGSSIGEYVYYEIGQSVRVVYNVDKPYYNKATQLSISRIREGLIYILMALFLAFLCTTLWQLRNTFVLLKRIETGRLIYARRKGRKFHSNSEAGTYYRLTYEFNGNQGGKVRKKILTSRSKRFKDKVLIAVDSKNDKKAGFLGTLPLQLEQYAKDTFMTPKKA